MRETSNGTGRRTGRQFYCRLGLIPAMGAFSLHESCGPIKTYSLFCWSGRSRESTEMEESTDVVLPAKNLSPTIFEMEL